MGTRQTEPHIIRPKSNIRRRRSLGVCLPISNLKGSRFMRNERSVILSITLLVFFVCALPARASELDELKATIQSMQKSMEQMQKKIAELERENHQQKNQTATSQAAPPRQSKRRRPLQ